MKKIILIVALLLLGCGEETTNNSTTHIAPMDENGSVEPLFIDDVNVSDVMHMVDVDTITISDNGILVLCTDGAVCSVTTDDGNESADITTTTTTDNNSSS